MSHKDVAQECLARAPYTRVLKRGGTRVRGFYPVFVWLFGRFVWFFRLVVFALYLGCYVLFVWPLFFVFEFLIVFVFACCLFLIVFLLLCW